GDESRRRAPAHGRSLPACGALRDAGETPRERGAAAAFPLLAESAAQRRAVQARPAPPKVPSMTFRRTLLAAALAALPCGASAADLLAIYRDAQVSDPVYQSARAQYNASIEALPQARAGYLPLISGTASIFRNRVDEEIAGKFDYTTKTYAVTLSQPIFRLQNWIAIGEA